MGASNHDDDDADNDDDNDNLSCGRLAIDTNVTSDTPLIGLQQPSHYLYYVVVEDNNNYDEAYDDDDGVCVCVC